MTKTLLIALCVAGFAAGTASSAFAITTADCPRVVKVTRGSKLAAHIGPVSLTRSTSASNPDDLGYIHLQDACQAAGVPAPSAPVPNN